MIARKPALSGLLLILLFLALPGYSQVGHPAKGSWSGYLSPDTEQQTRIRLLVDDDRGQLNTVVNPGRRAVDATNTTLDASDWGMVIEAELPEGKLVLDGTLSNLGSWTNRRYTGTYTLGDKSGDFLIILN